MNSITWDSKEEFLRVWKAKPKRVLTLLLTLSVYLLAAAISRLLALPPSTIWFINIVGDFSGSIFLMTLGILPLNMSPKMKLKRAQSNLILVLDRQDRKDLIKRRNE